MNAKYFMIVIAAMHGPEERSNDTATAAAKHTTNTAMETTAMSVDTAVMSESRATPVASVANQQSSNSIQHSQRIAYVLEHIQAYHDLLPFDPSHCVLGLNHLIQMMNNTENQLKEQARIAADKQNITHALKLHFPALRSTIELDEQQGSTIKLLAAYTEALDKECIHKENSKPVSYMHDPNAFWNSATYLSTTKYVRMILSNNAWIHFKALRRYKDYSMPRDCNDFYARHARKLEHLALTKSELLFTNMYNLPACTPAERMHREIEVTKFSLLFSNITKLAHPETYANSRLANIPFLFLKHFIIIGMIVAHDRADAQKNDVSANIALHNIGINQALYIHEEHIIHTLSARQLVEYFLNLQHMFIMLNIEKAFADLGFIVQQFIQSERHTLHFVRLDKIGEEYRLTNPDNMLEQEPTRAAATPVPNTNPVSQQVDDYDDYEYELNSDDYNDECAGADYVAEEDTEDEQAA